MNVCPRPRGGGVFLFSQNLTRRKEGLSQKRGAAGTENRLEEGVEVQRVCVCVCRGVQLLTLGLAEGDITPELLPQEIKSQRELWPSGGKTVSTWERRRCVHGTRARSCTVRTVHFHTGPRCYLFEKMKGRRGISKTVRTIQGQPGQWSIQRPALLHARSTRPLLRRVAELL